MKEEPPSWCLEMRHGDHLLMCGSETASDSQEWQAGRICHGQSQLLLHTWYLPGPGLPGPVVLGGESL